MDWRFDDSKVFASEAQRQFLSSSEKVPIVRWFLSFCQGGFQPVRARIASFILVAGYRLKLLERPWLLSACRKVRSAPGQKDFRVSALNSMEGRIQCARFIRVNGYLCIVLVEM